MDIDMRYYLHDLPAAVLSEVKSLIKNDRAWLAVKMIQDTLGCGFAEANNLRGAIEFDIRTER